MLARFLSIMSAGSSSNFTNVNNNGNLTNNNSYNSNGVVPDSLPRTQQSFCDNNSVEKEIRPCGESPKRSHDASYLEGRSSYQHGSFSLVTDPYSLLLAYYRCREGVAWKRSVQNYEKHLLRNISESIKTLEGGGKVSRGFYHFTLRERGKVRDISSVHISERVVQRSLCDNALVPVLAPSLIYDSGASLDNKGVSFSRRRVKVHLLRHYRRHGNEGYAVSIDCKKYFASINHQILFDMLGEKIEDKQVLNLTKMYIKDFGEKGLGLGSQVSQICSVFFLHKIDHYAKEVLGLENYARYMDDSYFIVKTKEEAKKFLDLLRKKYKEFDLEFNENKTQIVKLTRGFIFLKSRYRLTKDGRIVVTPSPDSRLRMIRKLRKFKKMGKTLEEAKELYIPWRIDWIKKGGNPIPSDIAFVNIFARRAT